MIRLFGAVLLTLPAAAAVSAMSAVPAAAQATRGAAPGYQAQVPPGYWIDRSAEDQPVRRAPGILGAEREGQADMTPLPPPGFATGDGRDATVGHQFGPGATEQAIRPPGAVGDAAPSAAGPAPQGAQPPANTSVMTLPPEDQPETGQPKELPANLKKQLVDFATKEPAGTLIVDTPNTYLYLVLGNGKALRYGIGVGREGFTWAGTERISRMKEWPDWFPPSEMIERQPYLPRMMAGGPGNPLGARALYLGNTLYRIHGTNQPSTIGQTVSSGCIRLLNEDIEDLYSRVQTGTRVVVLPASSPAQTANAVPVPASAAPAPAPQGGPAAQNGSIASSPLPAPR